MSILGLVAFVTIFTILVAAHEFGHYLVARYFKMGVEEFAVGFGNPKWVFYRRQYKTDEMEADGTPKTETTEFALRPFPLGGFVRIKAMQPEEDGSETKVPGGFYSKPPMHRFWALFAGPLFSILAGLIILIPTLTIAGKVESVFEPVIGSMSSDGAAYQAGLRPGDRVVSVDGKPVSTFYEMILKVRDANAKPLSFVYKRDGKEFSTTVKPTLDKEPSPILNERLEPTDDKKIQSKIGISPDSVTVPLTFIEATTEAALLPFKMVQGMWGMIMRPSTIKDKVGGPISIARITDATVETGIVNVLRLAGGLSMMLGVMNLLPLGFLDGGQMCIAFIETLRRGRRLSFRIQGMVNAFGILVMLFMFVGVTFLDISRIVKDKATAAERKARAAAVYHNDNNATR